MFRNIKKDMELFKGSSKHILLFQLSYKLIAAAIIFPLLFLLVNTGMKFAGISYLTNEYILKTIMSPSVIATVFVILLMVIIYCAYEMSFMLAAYEYKRKDVHASLYATAFSAFRKMKNYLYIRNFPMLLFYIFAIIAVNIVIIVNLVFTQTIQNLFRIHILNGRWYVKTSLAAAILIIYVIVFFGVYSFHVFFLEDKSFQESYMKSFRMVREHARSTMWAILRYNLLIVLIIGVVYGLISVVLVMGVKILDMAYMGTAVYLSALSWVRTLLKVVLCCIAIPSSFLVITRNYYQFTNEEEIDYPLIYIKERYSKIHRWVYFGVIILSVCTLAINIVQSFNSNPFERIAIFHETKVTAHRGASINAPENTLAAFQAAMDSLSDYIELDVQMTSDGEIVIMHDNNTLRTTGVENKISDMTLEEVKKLDAGSWFSEEFAGEQIPTLSEVLELVNRRVRLNIEIKAEKNGLTIAEKVVKIIEEYDAVNYCVITSFDHASLQKVKECNQNIRVGYILSVAYGSFYEMDGIDFFSMNASFLTKRNVDAIHSSGKEVYAWTVNDKEAIKNLTNKGVDNIITDDPILAVETIYSRDTSETVLNMLKYVFNQ